MNNSKYQQIFNYLLEFSKLRNTTIRDIDKRSSYPEIIWFSNIPNDLNFENIIGFEEEDWDRDYWLKANKPQSPIEPALPKCLEELEVWIKKSSLRDLQNGPELLNEWCNPDGEWIVLTETESIHTLFQEYVEQEWEPWKIQEVAYQEELEKYEIVNSAYKKFFSLYSKTKQFGEEYELVIGLGLLMFKESDDTPLIKRHIITGKADIFFDQEEGSFTIGPDLNGVTLAVESEMITDFAHLNVSFADRNLNEKLTEFDLFEKPFSPKLREDILKVYVNSISASGEYLNSVDPIRGTPVQPTIVFRPAILLRKRNTKNLTAVYEKICADLEIEESDINLPLINDLLENKESRAIRNRNGAITQEPEPLFFPKKYNKEQVEIVNRLRFQNKVLVQGPPGTGKSHTIANLISHLLAKGKRILVTAHTKRALEVLKGQLPSEIAALAVNLLSSDSNAMKDLEGSVNKILNNLNHLNTAQLQIEITALLHSLLRLNEERAQSVNRLVAWMEKETRNLFINDSYSGTLIEIVETLNDKKENCTWFLDSVLDIEKSLEATKQFDTFLDNFLFYSKLGDIDFNASLPSVDNLIIPNDFVEWINLEQQVLHSKHNSDACLLKESHVGIIEDLTTQLQACARVINGLSFSWSERIIADCTSGLRSTWELVRDKTADIINRPMLQEDCSTIEGKYIFQYPGNKSIVQLKADAEALLDQIEKGKKLTGPKFFKSTEIKQRWYFLSEVLVNGQGCNTKERLVLVIKELRLKTELEHLSKIWSIPLSDELFSMQFKRFQAFLGELGIILNTLEKIHTLNPKLTSALPQALQEAHYDKNQLLFIKECLVYTRAYYQWQLLDRKVNTSKLYVDTLINPNPIATELSVAIQQKDYGKFVKVLGLLEDLQEDYQGYRNLQLQKEALSIHFPVLIKAIYDETFDFSNLAHLQQAIYWKHAQDYVHHYLSEQSEEDLLQKINRIEARIREQTGEVAAKKGWLKVLNRLEKNSTLITHLQAWSQAVQKIGKTGKGKRARKFRKVAQIHLQKSKEAVPCWIMPMYRVAETVSPQPEIFDYCIIDEASQLGPDAIFLMYLAKKIIIVGDDKQTSPEYIGVNSDNVNFLIQKHLTNIPFKNFYGTEFSFFDHAKLFCNAVGGGMLVLREHFRCMPEIISFCNQHWYAPNRTPLYPMRQFSMNRLKPLMNTYVIEGNVEGKSSSIINKPEASAIAKQIQACIEDPNYEGKTFGVITLQGRSQASIIEKVLIDTIGVKEMNKRNLVCGFSTDFQGDERDVIFLSLVTAYNHQSRALTSANDERRFNVAVSRAKDQLWLFHSVQSEDLKNPEDLRFKLLQHFQQQNAAVQKSQVIIIPAEKTRETLPKPFDSWFEVDVYNEIVNKNYSAIPQHKVGEFRIDMVAILNNGTKIAIECDGDKFHGPAQYESDIMRQKALERCGWQFFRIRGSEYYFNKEKALIPLWKLLDKNDTSVFVQEASVIESSKQTTTTPYNGIPKTSENDIALVNHTATSPSSEPKVFTANGHKPPDRETRTKPLFIPEVVFSKREILAFTNQHRVYKYYNYEKWVRTNEELLNEFELESGENILYVCGTDLYDGHMLFAYENGKIAKVPLNSYKTESKRRRLKNAYNQETRLVRLRYLARDIDLIAYSSNNKVVLFNTKDINAKSSTSSIGIQVIKLKFRNYLKGVKLVRNVDFEDLEYYRKNIPASGFSLKETDQLYVHHKIPDGTEK